MLLLLCQQLDSLILSERAPFEVANVPWCDSILPPFPSLFISIFLLFPFPSIFIYTFFKMVNHVLNVDHLCKKIQNDHIFHCLSFYLKIFEQKERQWHCLSLMLKFSKVQPEGEGDDSAPPWKEGQTRTCSFQQQPMPTPTGKQFQKCILQILIDHLLPLCQAVLVSQDQDPASISRRFQVCHVKSSQTEMNLNTQLFEMTVYEKLNRSLWLL